MYELNRMRLFSVGPRGARYSDVVLDLSAAGAAIGGQQNLFTEPTRRVRRDGCRTWRGRDRGVGLTDRGLL
jgi:hypothetical protein